MQIELVGSYTARTTHRGASFEITTKGKDPVPVLARQLMKREALADTVATIVRSGKPVWKRDRTLADWGAISVTENDKGIIWQNYVPHPMALERSAITLDEISHLKNL